MSEKQNEINYFLDRKIQRDDTLISVTQNPIHQESRNFQMLLWESFKNKFSFTSSSLHYNTTLLQIYL